MVSNNYNWKILVGGAGGVGKTTFLFRYLTQQFISNTALTVGVQLHSHSIQRYGKKIGLVIWDLGGQERFKFLHENYMKGASAALVMYDISQLNTLFQAKEWIDLFRSYSAPAMPILLVGSKLDIVDEIMHQESEIEASNMVMELGLAGYIETSSKWGKNVEETMNHLVDLIATQKIDSTDVAEPDITDS
ncbi:MAG TPA: Rab family GTPase [Candidatus Lokiarchaeia archaeon]|nr:Rab family GTPase [Candidatus Lokiarchaeia archaeon]